MPKSKELKLDTVSTKKGRPTIYNAQVRRRIPQVLLSTEEFEKCRRVGGGRFAAGLRKMIAAYAEESVAPERVEDQRTEDEANYNHIIAESLAHIGGR